MSASGSRMMAGDKSGTFAGESESRMIAGESEPRIIAGESESRIIAGQSGSRTIAGQSGSRMASQSGSRIASQSGSRMMAGQSESRMASQSGSRMTAGASGSMRFPNPEQNDWVRDTKGRIAGNQYWVVDLLSLRGNSCMQLLRPMFAKQYLVVASTKKAQMAPVFSLIIFICKQPYVFGSMLPAIITKSREGDIAYISNLGNDHCVIDNRT